MIPKLAPLALALTAVAPLVLGPAAPAAAQDQPPPAEPAAEPHHPPPVWRLGLRLGAFDMINSSDSYDAVYGDPMPQLGVALEVEVHRWLVGLTLDHGEIDGEQVLPGRPPRPTGVEETLTYRPLALTAAWLVNPDARWRWHLGGGLTLLDWEDEGITRSNSGTDPGAHAVAGVRRTPGRWSFGGELRWSTVPDAVGDGGITRFFGEDDLGGVSLHLTALHRLGRRQTPQP